MNLNETLKALEDLGTEKARDFNVKRGYAGEHFGVKMGDIRGVAKRIKIDHDLALSLWKTGNLDAMLLATLVVKPDQISADELEKMVAAAEYTQLADWLNSYVVKAHPLKEELRLKWLESGDEMVRRSAWSLTSERIYKDPAGLDLGAMLDRLEREMPNAPVKAQWTMNYCLAAIGINFPEHRERALAMGEKIGAFRDYPTPKGCTSPYAPLWIAEMVSRQK